MRQGSFLVALQPGFSHWRGRCTSAARRGDRNYRSVSSHVLMRSSPVVVTSIARAIRECLCMSLTNELESTELWRQFNASSHDQQRATVRALIAHAAPLLSRVPDSFPTYTLHDERHALNIIKLVSQLLHNDLERASGLECAILILMWAKPRRGIQVKGHKFRKWPHACSG
jgi:hypothetical protein